MSEVNAPTGRVVLFGATGYTGELTAREMAKQGMTPVLSGRRREPLEALAAELGGLESQVADVDDPASVRALVEKGDTLVTTVGPFTRWGDPALDAALDAGAHYLDSTGEPGFVRKVFEEGGPRAENAGSVAMTALGYDWVPGNLTGALAVSEAPNAAGVRIGYFVNDSGMGGMSGGTRASLFGALVDPSFHFRGGSLVTERGAKKVGTFQLRGKQRDGVSVGTSEAFSLPRAYPNLQDVEVYLGWFGPQTKAMARMSAVGNLAMKVPGMRAGVKALAARFVKGSTGGPDEEARAAGGSLFIAEAFDSAGKVLATVETAGVSGYEFTARFLAWASKETAAGNADKAGAGARGPVEAFGLEGLTRGAEASGIARSSA